jgi:hypothetical protein
MKTYKKHPADRLIIKLRSEGLGPTDIASHLRFEQIPYKDQRPFGAAAVTQRIKHLVKFGMLDVKYFKFGNVNATGKRKPAIRIKRK